MKSCVLLLIGLLISGSMSAQISVSMAASLIDDSRFLANGSYMGNNVPIQSSGSYAYTVQAEYKRGRSEIGLFYSEFSTNVIGNQLGSRSIISPGETGSETNIYGLSLKQWLITSAKLRAGLGCSVSLAYYSDLGSSIGGYGKYRYSPDSTPTYIISKQAMRLNAPKRGLLSFQPFLAMEADVYRNFSITGQFGVHFTYEKAFYFSNISFEERYKSEDAYKARLDQLSGGTYTGFGNIRWPTMIFADNFFRDIRPMFSLGVKYTFRRKARGTPDMGS